MRSRRLGGADATAAHTSSGSAHSGPSHGIGEATPLSSAPSAFPPFAAGAAMGISEMDPWKDDRCRDFIVLNTIQRLRAYHLPPDAPMPEVEPVNWIRSRNLVMLPRARPDYRPCQGEHRPTRAERRAQREAKRREHRGAKPVPSPTTSPLSSTSEPHSALSASSSLSTSGEDDDDGEQPSGSHRHAASSSADAADAHGTTERQTPPPDGVCAIDRARVHFFGAQSFTSSTSPRHLINTPHVPLTPSPVSATHRKSRPVEKKEEEEGCDEAKGGAVTAGTPGEICHALISRSLKEDLDAFFSADGATDRQSGEGEREQHPQTALVEAEEPLPSREVTALKQEGEDGLTKAVGEGGDGPSAEGPSPAPRPPREPSLPLMAAEGGAAPAYFSCEVTAALLAHFQSLLTRGVVLDKLTHKEMGFAWWVVGREMSAGALQKMARPPRREALLITLRNFYYSALTDHERRVAGTGKPSAADEDTGQTAAGTTAAEGSESKRGGHTLKGGGLSPSASAFTTGRSQRAAAARARAAMDSMVHAATTATASTTAKRKKTASTADGHEVPPPAVKLDKGVAGEEGSAGVKEAEGTGSAFPEERRRPSPSGKGRKPSAAGAQGPRGEEDKEPPTRLQRREEGGRRGHAQTDSPEPTAASGDNTPHHDEDDGGDKEEAPHEGRAHATEASSEEDGESDQDDKEHRPHVGRGDGADRGEAPSAAVLPGRGRTHGQQGKAAARRQVIEAIWRPLRMSQRRGASVTAPPFEETSRLTAPTEEAVSADKSAPAAPRGAAGKKKGTSAAATAKAMVRRTEDTASERSAGKTGKAASGGGGGTAVRAAAAAAAGQREYSLPRAAAASSKESTELPRDTSSLSGKKRVRGGGGGGASEQQVVPIATGKHSSAGGKTATATDQSETGGTDADGPPSSTAAVSAHAPAPAAGASSPPSPPPPPSEPTPQELAAAAQQAYARATEAFHLVPAAADRVVEARIARRMAAAALAKPAAVRCSSATATATATAAFPTGPSSSAAQTMSRAGSEGARAVGTEGEEHGALPARSSYAFLLSSATHLPRRPAVKKKRRPVTARTASPWESVTPPSTADVAAVADASAVGDADGMTSAAKGQQSSAARAGDRQMDASATSTAAPAMAAPHEERTERRGRKRKLPARLTELDVDGAVDPVLMHNVVRHDQARVEQLVAARQRAAAEMNPCDTGEGVAGPQGHVVKAELLDDAVPIACEQQLSFLMAEKALAAASVPLSLQARRDALVATPFDALPYALQCLLTWEAADLLERHRRTEAVRRRRRQRTAGLQRTTGPVTRRMAAMAARGELPSTSSGSSEGSADSDEDDEDDEEEEGSDGSEDMDSSDSSSSSSSNAEEASAKGRDGEAGVGKRGSPPAQRVKREVGRREPSPPHARATMTSLPRCFFDYWAEYRSA